MDEASFVASTPRPSAIPRLSKLPLPRPGSSIATYTASTTRSPLPLATSPEHRPNQSVGRQSLLATVRGRSSILPPPPLPAPNALNATARKPLTAQVPKRQPLGPPLRAQSKQEPRPRHHQPDQIEVDGVLYVKAQRRLSDQENLHQDEYNGYETSAEPVDSPTQVVSPAPSLSDRTIESLAHVPSAPSSVRRRSSFFNPHSPMTPSRPPSTIDAFSISKLSYGSVRRSALPRQSTSYSRPDHAGQASTPARPVVSTRSISSALPKTTITPARSNLSSRNGVTPAKPAARPASVAAFPRPPSSMQVSSRMSVARITRPSSSLSTTTKVSTLNKASSRPMPETKPIGSSARQSQPLPTVKRNDGSLLRKPTATSTLLRSQMTQARSSQRDNTWNPSQPLNPGVNELAELNEVVDPFNQISKNEMEPLQRRIDAARRDGRLNIASLGFKTIPEQVLHMYDAEAMESSSISWNETVDISRFIAADNDLEAISDEVFPDLGAEELANSEDANGSLFGGVELLDLHGNMLQSLPVGLRRLELLTTLNLSRNKFENTIFDVLTQIPSLREIRLADNDLSRDLPESIGFLTNLETLDVHGNKLVLLPTSMRSLIRLRVLDLSDNRFSDLAMTSLVQLPSLIEIHASKMHSPALSFRPPSSNSPTSAYWTLPSLTYLNISQNRLFTLPDIGDWTSLATLLAEDNQLTELPPRFTTSASLRTADFRGNCIRVVDKLVGRMQGLQRLALEGNPLRERRWLSLGWEAVKGEMVRRLEEAEAEEQQRGVSGVNGLGITLECDNGGIGVGRFDGGVDDTESRDEIGDDEGIDGVEVVDVDGEGNGDDEMF